MSYSIKHLYHIDAPTSQVFEAISTIQGLANWWTTDTKGASAVNDVIEFYFNGSGPKMKVIASDPNSKVIWECIDSPYGWTGHTLEFLLDENDGKTRIRFSHNNWEGQDDSYAICSFTWGRYLESLRQYCQTGTGQAFGSEGYK